MVSTLAPIKWKTGFKILPFKFDLHRYIAGTGKPYVLLAMEILVGLHRGRINEHFIKYRIQRPNIAYVPAMNLVDLRNNYRLAGGLCELHYKPFYLSSETVLPIK